MQNSEEFSLVSRKPKSEEVVSPGEIDSTTNLLEKVDRLEHIIQSQNESLRTKWLVIEQQNSQIEDLKSKLRAKEQVIQDLSFFRRRIAKTFIYKAVVYSYSLSKRLPGIPAQDLNRK